ARDRLVGRQDMRADAHGPGERAEIAGLDDPRAGWGKPRLGHVLPLPRFPKKIAGATIAREQSRSAKPLRHSLSRSFRPPPTLSFRAGHPGRPGDSAGAVRVPG